MYLKACYCIPLKQKKYVGRIDLVSGRYLHLHTLGNYSLTKDKHPDATGIQVYSEIKLYSRTDTHTRRHRKIHIYVYLPRLYQRVSPRQGSAEGQSLISGN